MKVLQIISIFDINVVTSDWHKHVLYTVMCLSYLTFTVMKSVTIMIKTNKSHNCKGLLMIVIDPLWSFFETITSGKWPPLPPQQQQLMIRGHVCWCEMLLFCSNFSASAWLKRPLYSFGWLLNKHLIQIFINTAWEFC